MGTTFSFPVPRYAIGDKVFSVATTTAGGRHPCPDCGGANVWKVTSPAGVEMEMDCPRCQRDNYNDALALTFTKHVPYVQTLTIGSIRIDTHDRENPVEYMCEETGVGSGTIHYESRLYPTREEADAVAAARCAEKQAEHDATPRAMERAERSRMGYFAALQSGLRDAARVEARERLRSEFEGEVAEGEFTPGPWVASGRVTDDGVFTWDVAAPDLSSDYGSWQVCSGYGGLSSGFAKLEQGPANARLIAAAPDLLNALLMLKERGHTQATWEAAERAMAKATQP